MKIHEYQAKEILKKYGVPVPKGRPAFSIDEAEAAAKALIAETDNEVVVVKAQIHAGGRGKGGGVKVVKGAAAARETAQKILGMKLVTHQTGPERQDGQAPARSSRASTSRASSTSASSRPRRRPRRRDGVDRGRHGDRGGRRQDAREDPQGVGRPGGRPAPASRRASSPTALGLHGDAAKNAAELIMQRSTGASSTTDASLLEINPLVVHQGRATCWRSTPRSTSTTTRSSATRTWRRCATSTRRIRAEIEAKRYDLTFIKLDGNIGCMVNGAGLAMATMDIIKLYGGAAGELPRRRRRRHRRSRSPRRSRSSPPTRR